MGEPCFNHLRRTLSGHLHRFCTLPTMLYRHLPAACFALPSRADRPRAAATLSLALSTALTAGGCRTGLTPTAKGKSCNSGSSAMAFRCALRTGAIAAASSSHLSTTRAGLRIPALHSASSLSRTSFFEAASTPRVASRSTLRGGETCTSASSSANKVSSRSKSDASWSFVATVDANAAFLPSSFGRKCEYCSSDIVLRLVVFFKY